MGPGPALRVVIADADARFADRLEAALEAEKVACVGRASSEAEIVEIVRSESPDVAFVALDSPGAAAATRRILEQAAPPRVVLISSGAEPAFPAAVSGYVRRGEDAAEVAGVVAALCPLTRRPDTPADDDVDDDPSWAQAGALDAS